jgi:4-amino-4-deoxy-L-arabinose transferase-like glycosyltransferase
MGLQIVDEQHYATLAGSLFRGHGFAWAEGQPTSLRPPLYPFVVASVWKVAGGESVQAVRAVQTALSLATVVLVYILAHHVFDRGAALLAAAVVCLYPSLLFSGVLLLTEILFSFLLVALALLYARLMKRPTPLAAIAVGVALGLAALTRSVLWPFPLVLAPLTFASVTGTKRRRAAMAGIVVIGYAIVVVPWAVRNTRVQGTLTIVETLGALNLRMGNYEHTPMDRMWDAVSLTGEQSWSYDLGREHPEARYWTEGRKAQWAQAKALKYMLQHPGVTLERAVVKFADFWGLERELVAGLREGLYHPPAWLAWLAVAALALSYPLVALGAVLGMFRAVPANRGTHALVLSIIVFMAAIHTPVFGHSRYHLPLVPFLAVYAAAGVAGRCWEGLLVTWRRAAAPIIAMAVLVGIWAHEILLRDTERLRDLFRMLT